MDLLKYIGFDFPPITGIVLSSLLYFILLMIAYPQLNELHDFFARALVIASAQSAESLFFYVCRRFFQGDAFAFFHQRTDGLFPDCDLGHAD